MQLIKEKCTGCGYCVLVCPYDALKTDGWAEVIPENCTDCNLCVYACPSDCFVPDVPLRAYTPRVKAAYDVVIIGSGIGGLMAGVALAQAGHSVAVFEKLGFPGGRYTEIDYKGAAVTTGAWTNLGPASHIGRFLQDVGIDLDYVSLADLGLSEQYSLRFPDGRAYHSLYDLLSTPARKAWLKAILTGKKLMTEQKKLSPPVPPEGGEIPEIPPSGGLGGQKPTTNSTAASSISQSPISHLPSPNLPTLRLRSGQVSQSPISPSPHPKISHVSTTAYLTEFCDDPDLLAAVDAIAATTSGLSSDLMPASEYIQITLDAREVGRHFAMPVGGVRSIIKALVTALRQAGGDLFVRTPVAEILTRVPPDPPKGGEKTEISSPERNKTNIPPSGGLGGITKRVAGIRLTDGREVSSRVVLHNGGPRAFVKLVGSDNLPPAYLERLNQLKGVECAAIFGATREPLFDDAPMTMTPNCRRVVGIFAPTLLDPKLSKHGLHLFDAFFPTYSDDRTAELELAMADLRDLFPNFDEVVAWTIPMFFTGTWPGTESGQTFGQTGDQRLDPATPIENCFLVGMDVKGSGVAGDLIPLGVRRALACVEEVL